MASMLYNIFINIYPLAIKIAALFNNKASDWVKGRKGIFEALQASIKKEDNIIWMHCASLGEFEQGRPVLEKLNLIKNPGQKILLTFFSPSGYEVQKNYDGADYVFYLPMDSKEHSRRFFDVVQPTLILFVKYEFWYYYFKEAQTRKIPLLLVSAIFRKDQPFFKWYGGTYKKMLRSITHFFVQNKASVQLLSQLGYNNEVTISGDTRFDRVLKIASQFKEIDLVKTFCSNSKVVVAGSTWTEDDKELDHFANTNPAIKFIIAPHNIGKDRIDECLHLYKNALTYSALSNGGNAEGKNTLIIDNIGMLSTLYGYADVCYVGGGFGADGVHNVLEPAVYGKPVVFGPEYEKFDEAEGLLDAGGALSVDNALELDGTLGKLLRDDEKRKHAGEQARIFVNQQAGATDKVITYIQEKRLLTN